MNEKALFYPDTVFFYLCVFQINKQQLQTVKERFQSFLSGETQIVADEAFINAVQSYYDVSLPQMWRMLFFTGARSRLGK